LISVGFAPPVLPVYVQPPCPQQGWMWTPGYWAYGPDGYYWVPGTWVPAPQPGFYWTPGYWGWSAGLYVWHGGYWGPHVGYYGGVNYGFGYMGIGFVGGVWHGHDFAYNTAVVNVNRTVIHNTYIDNTVVRNNTIVNDRHVAFSGGPGGVNHPPTPQENNFSREQHMGATSFQSQHESAARTDRSAYFNNNHGNPSHVAMVRPAGGNPHGSPGNHGPASSNPAYHENKTTGNNPLYEGHGSQTYRPSNAGPSSGGQQHGQTGMAVKGQGVPDNPRPKPQMRNATPPQPHNPPQQNNQHGGDGNQGHDHGRR
jgi:hypothetical protein